MAQIDVGIIGAGPAGLTAAATLARQLHTAVVFDSGSYRNGTSSHMHTVPGWDGKDPNEFRETSRSQIECNYDTITFIDVGIESIEKNSDSLFNICDTSGKQWQVKKVILAIGCNDVLPELEGYRALWKTHIYHCLFCLGYEEKGAPATGVLAIQALAMIPALAIHMADNAAQLSNSVTIFTHGATEVADQIKAMAPKSPFKIEPREIKSLAKRDRGVELLFQDGSSQIVSFLAHSPLTTPQGPFVTQLNLQTSAAGDIQADAPTYQTSSRGVFAVGDCISPFKVIPHAIASGNFAAVAVATQLQAEKYGHASMV